jgi:PKD repeat protein
MIHRVLKSIVVVILAIASTAMAFNAGDRVRCNGDGVRVRSTTDPNSTTNVLGLEYTGYLGTFQSGPVTSNGYTWYYVKWDNLSSAGYTVSTYVEAVSSTPGSFTLSNDTPVCNTSAPAGPSVTLHWTASSGATSYDLYRNGSLYAQNITQLQYVNNANLTAGQTYSYYLKAKNTTGSTQSNTINVAIPANICASVPGNFTLSNDAPVCNTSAPAGPSVTLHWTASSGATSYDLYRDGSLYAQSITQSQYVNNANLTAGQTYTYYVKANNSAGSTQSNTISVPIPANICASVPGNFTLSNDSPVCNTSAPAGPSVTLHWTASSGAPSYDLYRNGSLYAQGITQLQYVNNASLTAGQTYTYYIKAKNSTGSTQSNTVTVPIPADLCGLGPQLSITSTGFNPSSATVGVAYAASSAVTATGGQPPYTWSATGFPNGMSINSSSGAPFGTPTVAGTFSITVTVKDSSSPQQSVSKVLTLLVSSSATGVPTISGISPSTVTGSDLSQNFTITGTNFVQGTKVQVAFSSNNSSWVNTKIDASYVAPGQLTVPIITQTNPDIWRVRVLNPDGQPSAGYVTLTVNAPPAATLSVDHFDFGAIASPQTVGVPFPVSITAADAKGQVVSAFNGRVDLSSSSAAKVAPTYVTCSNGRWSGNVALDQPGYNTSLRGSSGAISGSSNQFEVRSPTQINGKLQGFVKNIAGVPLINASVQLSSPDGGYFKTTLTSVLGYRFDSIPAGTYVLSASAESLVSQGFNLINISAGATVTYDVAVGQSAPKPVLLVGGIMGTTSKTWNTRYPMLFGEIGDPAQTSNLILYDPVARVPFVGHRVWKDLSNLLSANGFNPVPVPWDWRKPIEQAYKQYLIPAIDKAKRSPTDRVDIVAHSQGGLMVRAYVQSVDYRGDIDKLAIVGTPNTGAAISYYIAEGADPVTADSVSGSSIYLDSLYTTVLENLFYYNADPPGRALYNKVGVTDGVRYDLQIPLHTLKDFINVRQLPSVAELMPIFKFVNKDGVVNYVDDYSVSPLMRLDASPYKSRMTFENGDSQLIRTKLFYSSSEPTIIEIPVSGTAGPDGTYSDGVPVGRPRTTSAGDGTVLAVSVLDDLAAVSRAGDQAGSHPFLMSGYKDEIVSFLSGTSDVLRQSETASGNATTTGDSAASELAISVVGRVQPFLSDPSGRGLGIDLQTGDMRIEMPDATVSVTSALSGLNIANPVQGPYTLQVSGVKDEPFTINLARTVDSNFDEKRINFIYRGSPITIAFLLDESNPLQLVGNVAPPQEVKSENVGGSTVLSWSPAQGSDIVEYHIYSRADGSTGFVLLGTTTTTSFATNDTWNADGSGPRWSYAVVSVAADGRESYFADMLRNDSTILARFSPSTKAGAMPLTVTFTDTSVGSPMSWAWDFDGDGIIDSTEANPTHVYSRPGVYTVTLTASGPNGSDTRTEVSSIKVELPNQLANISTRLPVGTGDNAMIGGFIITGSQPKTVIVRGIGPSLGPLGVPNTLADPVIEVHDSSGALIPGAINDNWQDAATKQQIIDSGLAPTNDLESALLGTINPGAYTVIVRGKDGGTGNGVFEVYDLDRTQDSKLGNISTRGFVNTDDNVMIGGTIIIGSTPTQVLFRAIGPSLTNFGVPNALQDPSLELHDGNGGLLEANDNWQDSPNKQAIIETTIAPTNDRESAILRTLGPGAYTAIVRGTGNSTGVAVVEAYQLP